MGSEMCIRDRSTVEDGWIIVEATRKINTGDTQDNALKNDKELWGAPTRIIAAWGDDEALTYHGDKLVLCGPQQFWGARPFIGIS